MLIYVSQGFALEVEPIDIPIITQLGKWSPEEGSVKAPIHWSTDFVDIKTRDPRRKPFILILDEIVSIFIHSIKFPLPSLHKFYNIIRWMVAISVPCFVRRTI